MDEKKHLLLNEMLQHDEAKVQRSWLGGDTHRSQIVVMEDVNKCRIRAESAYSSHKSKWSGELFCRIACKIVANMSFTCWVPVQKKSCHITSAMRFSGSDLSSRALSQCLSCQGWSLNTIRLTVSVKPNSSGLLQGRGQANTCNLSAVVQLQTPGKLVSLNVDKTTFQHFS